MAEGSPLRWLFFGCGAVGGYFGARLAEKGQKVSFMVRKETLRAVAFDGVRVQSICGDLQIPREKLDQVVNTEELDKEAKFDADVIVLACKAWEVERCLRMCAPWCGEKTVVLPLQNGVDGMNTARSIVTSWGKGHPLVGWCNIVAAIQEPGLIKHWAANPPAVYFGEFEGQATARTKQLETIFAACKGVAVHLEPDALCACWEKFSFICSTTAVQATAGPTATQNLIPQVPELEQMWRSAMQEIMAVARAHGINYKEEWIEKRIPVLAEAVGATTSCSRDLWAGRHSELEDLLGSAHRMGLAKGVPTPVISTCYRTLTVRDRVARREVTMPIYPMMEGQKILGTICNHRGQQLPADRTLVQKKAEEFLRPEWFVCPMSSAIASGGQSEIPEGVHMMWEAEMGVVISHRCEKLSVEEAMNYVGGYCVVLDLTGGNLGFETMKYGMSWTRNKCQSSFKPVGRFIPAGELPDPEKVRIGCRVNGKTVASDEISRMKFSIAEQVADASELTPLQRGDILLTGAGSLGPLAMGDLVEGYIEGLDAKYTVSTKLVPKPKKRKADAAKL
ncbi:Acylpyruvase FAHD1 [Durusdinium trenchii]|uniref:Mitochondrial (Fumarylacetoacetate hydrolase domain-containing protein 1) (FAH domain-containing protein 1) (Oxaloacetate decarboxylase) (OAA decarboxylase) (YisK-like protein) n=1 Tax=Durusdinium trenchii TaxID=1381693 RepID=A0ABP0KXK0_9DINO